MFTVKCQNCGKFYKVSLDNFVYAWIERCSECLEEILEKIKKQEEDEENGKND